MNHEEYERMYRFEDRYWWFIARRRLIASLISDRHAKDGSLKILDIGCGTGAMLDELAPFGQVTGADFAVEALAFCRQRSDKYPLTRADARRLPFASNTFDVVTAMDIIEHIDNDKAASAEIFRVLKPGGQVYITVPAYQSLWSEHDEALHHHRRYTSPMMRDLLQRVGFRVDKLSYTVSALLPGVWLYRKVTALFKRDVKREKKADLVDFSAPVNSALLKLTTLETQIVRGANLPFGVTVACVAEKPR